MNEEKIYGELIWALTKTNRLDLVETLLKKLKREGKFYLSKNILIYLEEKNNEENNIIQGKLKLALPTEVEKVIYLLNKKLKNKIILEKVEIDKNLILGGVFIGKNIQLDFSFKNLLRRIIFLV